MHARNNSDASLVGRWHRLERGRVSGLRDRALERLGALGLTEGLDDARLLLAELLANAARHAYAEGPGTLRVWRSDATTAVVAVQDSSPVLPALPCQHGPAEIIAGATSGWGLPLISSLSQRRCGVVPLPQGGKAVWASLPLGAGGVSRPRLETVGLVRAQILVHAVHNEDPAHRRGPDPLAMTAP